MSFYSRFVYLTLFLFSGILCTCKVETVHITLGDYFTDKSSPVVYRVGFMDKDGSCKNAQVRVTYKGDAHVDNFKVTNERHYSIDGDFKPWSSVPVKYDRHFYFVELSKLKDFTTFTYQIMDGETKLEGPFDFKSNVYLGGDHRVFSFGDHDVGKYVTKPEDVGKPIPGLEVIEHLEKTHYDLLILLGDLAYEIQDGNGLHGDGYFQKMQKAMTKAPVVTTPGNHENIDKSLMINNRFMMPGTKEPDDNNLFTFHVGKTIYYSFNFDLFIEIFPTVPDSYTEAVREKFTKAYDIVKPKWSVFFSHRSFICSDYRQLGAGCIVSPFITKYYEDLLESLNVNVYLFAHIHTYERYLPVFDYEVQKTRRDKTMIISGAAANSHWFKEQDFYGVDFLAKFISGKPGLVVVDKFTNSMKTAFMLSKDGSLLDENVLIPASDTVAQKPLVLVDTNRKAKGISLENKAAKALLKENKAESLQPEAQQKIT